MKIQLLTTFLVTALVLDWVVATPIQDREGENDAACTYEEQNSHCYKDKCWGGLKLKFPEESNGWKAKLSFTSDVKSINFHRQARVIECNDNTCEFANMPYNGNQHKGGELWLSYMVQYRQESSSKKVEEGSCKIVRKTEPIIEVGDGKCKILNTNIDNCHGGKCWSKLTLEFTENVAKWVGKLSFNREVESINFYHQAKAVNTVEKDGIITCNGKTCEFANVDHNAKQNEGNNLDLSYEIKYTEDPAQDFPQVEETRCGKENVEEEN